MDIDDPVELKTFWQSHIEAWQNTPLTQATYCQENELSVHRFGYWKRKLVDTKPVTFESSGFFPLNPVLSTSTLALHLPNQLRIEGINAENLHLAKQLVEALQ